ncbi:MAG: hypothetical protein B7C24_00620 [Bacteroidetes bacterium 4572_77]|nr:MAG: hypothetical protein B7C24_00620 [Bacteroidetes bacterium 4572_77]
MIERVKLLMSVKNLSSSDLAHSIQVQRSGISHILSGRNKASLDFVTKVLESFPDVREEWLLFGKGEMLKTTESQNPSSLFGDMEDVLMEQPTTELEKMEQDSPKMDVSSVNSSKQSEMREEDMAEYSTKAQKPSNREYKQESIASSITAPIGQVLAQSSKKKIIKLFAIYDDDSFKEYLLSED